MLSLWAGLTLGEFLSYGCTLGGLPSVFPVIRMVGYCCAYARLLAQVLDSIHVAWKPHLLLDAEGEDELAEPEPQQLDDAAIDRSSRFSRLFRRRSPRASNGAVQLSTPGARTRAMAQQQRVSQQQLRMREVFLSPSPQLHLKQQQQQLLRQKQQASQQPRSSPRANASPRSTSSPCGSRSGGAPLSAADCESDIFDRCVICLGDFSTPPHGGDDTRMEVLLQRPATPGQSAAQGTAAASESLPQRAQSDSPPPHARAASNSTGTIASLPPSSPPARGLPSLPSHTSLDLPGHSSSSPVPLLSDLPLIDSHSSSSSSVYASFADSHGV